MFTTLRISCFLLLVSSIFVATGCTGPKKAEVSGMVKIGEEPVTSGTVTFHGENKAIRTTQLTPEGKYKIADAVPGPNTITVKAVDFGKFMTKKNTAPPKGIGVTAPPSGMPETGGLTGKFVPVPAKYEDPTTSGLSYTVKEGKQEHDIILTK
jgi:hypothetical protein